MCLFGTSHWFGSLREAFSYKSCPPKTLHDVSGSGLVGSTGRPRVSGTPETVPTQCFTI